MKGDKIIIIRIAEDRFVIYRSRKIIGTDIPKYRLSICQSESPKDDSNDIIVGTYDTEEEYRKAVKEHAGIIQ